MNDIYKEDNDIEFEIRFLEGILKHNPNYIEGLVILGDFYTKQGLYEKGLIVDEKLSILQPQDPFVHYNLACSYSLVKDVSKALRSVKKAIRCGYNNFEYLEQDTDLTNLREDLRFQDYYARLKKRFLDAARDVDLPEEKDQAPEENFAQGSDEVVS